MRPIIHREAINQRIRLCIFWVLGLLSIVVLLTSCTTGQESSQSPQDTQAIRRFDAYDQLLWDTGVQRIRVGDNLVWVLPVDRSFYPNSANLMSAAYPVLDALASALKSYDKVSVKVAGYTDNRGSAVRNLALSKKRAHMVANALWRRGLDSRIIYATGYGEKQPIAGNQTAQGRAQNRRVEITFRQIKDA